MRDVALEVDVVKHVRYGAGDLTIGMRHVLHFPGDQNDGSKSNLAGCVARTDSVKERTTRQEQEMDTGKTSNGNFNNLDNWELNMVSGVAAPVELKCFQQDSSTGQSFTQDKYRSGRFQPWSTRV